MRPYSELNALAPEAFLNWEEFRTQFDGLEANVARRREKYEKGRETGQESTYVFISSNGTWGARGKRGSQTSSYEGIGYHALAADFWHGVLDSGVPICIYRATQDLGVTQTWIQGSEAEANARATTSLGRLGFESGFESAEKTA